MPKPFSYDRYIFCKYAGAVDIFDGNGNPIMYTER